MHVLTQEIETYNRSLVTLLDQIGKFVLVKGDALQGPFNTYQEALQAGYEQFALEPFLVKQVAPAEQVSYFTRDLNACQA